MRTDVIRACNECNHVMETTKPTCKCGSENFRVLLRGCNVCNRRMADAVLDEPYCTNCGNPEFRILEEPDLGMIKYLAKARKAG